MFVSPQKSRVPNFRQMRREVNRRADKLGEEVEKALPSGPSQRTAIALELVDEISDRFRSDNVVEGKRFMRHCIWAARTALEKEPKAAQTESIKDALEDTRNTCLDISWVKEMRKIPSRRWVVYPRPAAADIPNFERVNPDFLRGGQPDQGGVDWLKSQGVKTTIDLRGGDRENQWNETDFSGLNHQKIDIPDFHPPSFEQVEKAIEILDNPENHPVFLHCKAGVGRTGTVTACWRVAHGMSAEEALAKERINSYHGSLRQEQFVRDFEKHLKDGASQPPGSPQAPKEPEKDHWPLIYAYYDVSNGADADSAAKARGLEPNDRGCLEDFSAYWNTVSN